MIHDKADSMVNDLTTGQSRTFSFLGNWRWRYRYLLWIPFLLVLLVQLFPIWVIGLTSFKTPLALLDDGGALNLDGLFLGNYQRVIFEDGLWQYVEASLIIAMASTFLSVFAGGLAAYPLARYRFRGRKPLALGILCSRMVPPVALALPAFLLLRTFGAVDHYWGLILAHTTFNLPFAIWLLIPFFEILPADFEDAAVMDGLNAWQTFRLIFLPLALPGIVVASIFCFLMSWNDFLYSLILAGSDTRTAPLAINAYMTSDQIEWGAMTASSMLVLVPVFLLCRHLQNYLVNGLTAGGVKG
ncbi:MAG: ABC transporter permease [Zetaproteobacteria bacterium]|nr:ABC transporter permease [Pseudobdellovibrionaceae bacterium]